MTNREKLWLIIFALAVCVVLVLAYPGIIAQLAHGGTAPEGTLPRAYNGNRAAYAFAFASLFSLTSLSIRKVIIIAQELFDRNWREAPDIGLYRIVLLIFHSVFILGAGPDCVILMIWGEVTESTMNGWLMFDKICDGLCFPVFLVGTIILMRAEQLELVPLTRIQDALEHPSMTLRQQAFYLVVPRRDGIADHVKIIVAVVVIAIGLAALK